MDSMVLTSTHWSLPKMSSSEGPPKGFPKEIIIADPQSPTTDIKLMCSECHLVLRRPVQGPCGHRFCNSCVAYVASLSPEGKVKCRACAEETNNDESQSIFSKDEVHPDFALARKEFSKIDVRCAFSGCNWKGSLKDFEGHFDTCPHAGVICKVCGEKIKRPTTYEEHLMNNISTHVDALLDRIAQIEGRFDGRSCVDAADCSKSCPRISQSASPSAGRGDFMDGGKCANPSVPAGDDEPTKMTQLENGITVLMMSIEQIDRRTQKLEKFCTEIDELKSAIKARDDTIGRLKQSIELLEEASYDGTYVWRITDFSRRRREAVAGTCTSFYSSPFYTSKLGYKLCLSVFLNGDGAGRSTHLSVYFVVMRGMYDSLLVWPFNRDVTIAILGPSTKSSNGQPEFLVKNQFRPDPTSSSFKRPTADRNVGSGFPQFLPLTDLSKPRYVCDDTLFLHVSVATPP